MSGTLWAFNTASGSGNELAIALVEWRLFQKQEDVMLNPLVKMANQEQDSLRLVSGLRSGR